MIEAYVFSIKKLCMKIFQKWGKIWSFFFFAKTFHQASNSYFWRMEKCVDDPNYLILVKRLRMNQNLLKYLIMLWNEAPRDGRHTQGSSQRDNYNNWLSNAGCKHKQPCQMTSEIVFRHYFFSFWSWKWLKNIIFIRLYYLFMVTMYILSCCLYTLKNKVLWINIF